MKRHPLDRGFPDMTPEENARYVRHSGMYKVSCYDETIKCHVSWQSVSQEFFLDRAGWGDERKDEVCRALALYGSLATTDPQGRRVSIYY